MKNEKRALLPDQNGSLQPVADEGGMQCLQQLILDVQHTAMPFDDKVQASVDQGNGQSRRSLGRLPSALAISAQPPRYSFNARTHPACYVEWWIGDGARPLHGIGR